MKTLTIVLLLGQLALARPVLDLSALDRPGLTPAQRVQLLDQAFQKFPDPVSRLEIDCLRAEELFKAQDPRVCEVMRRLRQANIPAGPARARFLWLSACTQPSDNQPARLALLKEALSQPAVPPIAQMNWLRFAYGWLQNARDQREWFLARGRALAEASADPMVQIGWLDIQAREAESRGLTDQQRLLNQARQQMARKAGSPEEEFKALGELKASWTQIQSVVLNMPPGPRRAEMIRTRLWRCPDQKTAERWLAASAQAQSLPLRQAYCEWYWLNADKLGLDPEQGLAMGRKLLAAIQASGDPERELRFRELLSRELQTRGKLVAARQQLVAATQLRQQHPWEDPVLLKLPAHYLRIQEAELLRRQGCLHQALAIYDQLSQQSDLSPRERHVMLQAAQYVASSLGDQEQVSRYWQARLQASVSLTLPDRNRLYELLLTTLPADQELQRPPLLRLARQAAEEQISLADAGHSRIMAAQAFEHLLKDQKDGPALLQLWNRELERARAREDQIMAEWASAKLLENYFNQRQPEKLKALANTLLDSPSLSSELRARVWETAEALVPIQDPLALVWMDELVNLRRSGSDRTLLARALERRASVKRQFHRPEAALKDIQEALQLEPARSRSYAISMQASLLKELGRTDEARNLLRQDIQQILDGESPQMADSSLEKLLDLEPEKFAQWRQDYQRALQRFESLGEAGQGARDRLLFFWLRQLAREEAWEEGKSLLESHPWAQTAGQEYTTRLRPFKAWESLLPPPPPPAPQSSAPPPPDSLAVKLDELRLARPELGQWLSLRSSNIKHLQAHLGPHETLVTYTNLGDQSYVLVVRAQQTFWLSRSLDLERACKDYLAGLRSDQRSQAEGDLYSLLLEPVLRTDPNQRLLLVPTGNLWQLPFGALRDPRGESAASQAEIVMLTSGDLLRLADNSWQPYRLTAPLAIGAPPAADLPGAFAELGEVSQMLPGCQLRRGEAATVASLGQAEQPWGLVHFASHAHYNRDRPTESDIQLHGASLQMRDISRLPLAEHALVVLSCCQGGSADKQDLEEPVTMATSFAAAGADTVVGNLWRVDDEVARLFFSSFYKEISQGASPAHSFRKAQLSCRASYPKTRDWGGFFLLGNPN